MGDDDLKKMLRMLKSNLEDATEELNDAVPGLGIMVHGLAHAVVKATMPPDSFIKFKKEYEKEHGEDALISIEMVAKEHPEIHNDMEAKGKAMSELVEQCVAIIQTPPKKLVEEAIKLAKHRREQMNAEKKGWSFDSDDSTSDDDEDAPLKGGWHTHTKGNA